MSNELRSLDVAELLRLGGLKKQCDSPLVCAAHTNPHPCELCELEGSPQVACSICHHEFADGVTEGGQRPCASERLFALSGAIAFEAQALAALNTERESASARKRREREEAKRQLDEKTRTERAEAERTERQERSRHDKETAESAREAAARARAEAAAGEAAASVQGARYARWSAWASLASAVLGALLLWQNPLVEMPELGPWYLLLYGSLVVGVWGTAALTLAGQQKAHDTLRWWSVGVWMFTCFAWPGLAALTVCFVAAVTGLSFFAYLVHIVAGLGLFLIALMSVTHCSVAFSMKPPWPQGLMAANFKGLRSFPLWVALAATLGLNLKVWNGPEGAIDLGGAMLRAPAAAKPLLKARSNKPAPDQKPMEFAQAHLADLVQAVADRADLTAAAGPGVVPAVDVAARALAQLPRPTAGDRNAARNLYKRAGQMMSRNAPWADVVDVLQQAYQADAQDVQILNDLAFAQVMAGRADMALENILLTLTLSPMRANAWATLGLIRAALAEDEPAAIQESSRYYLVAYWFSQDRPRTLRIYRGKLNPGPFDPPANSTAVNMALVRLPP